MTTILAGVGISGLFLLFSWVFASSLGIPGAMITMIAFGSLAENIQTLTLIIIFSFIAAVLGDILAYEIARKISTPLLKGLRKFSFFNKNELKARDLLNKHSFSIVFFTRFALISLCAVISYISGLEKLSRKKFYSAVISGEFLYALIYPIIGFVIGELLNNLLSAINDVAIVIILLVLVFYFVRFIIPKIKHHRAYA